MRPTSLLPFSTSLLAIAMLTACGKAESPSEPAATAATAEPAAPMPVPADAAPPAGMNAASRIAAKLSPTQGNTANGELQLVHEGMAVHITGSLTGLKPNAEFGFHIHEKGDCSAPDASSAGGHFNPTNAQHGNPQGESHHAGDMMNAKSDAQGNATVDAVASGVSLGTGQADDVSGKAIVLHQQPDDYSSQPAGNSGARIACAVIGQ
jgi:Cu-Zn family superoxide dismutase